MIDITSFLLKHLYELMADNYNAAMQRDNELVLRRQHLARSAHLSGANLNGGGGGSSSGSAWCLSSVGQGGEVELENALNGAEAGADVETGAESGAHESRLSVTSDTNRPPERLQQTTRANSNSSPTTPLGLIKRLSCCQRPPPASQTRRQLVAREQETNQQIVSFLINNQLPDLACETLIELIFISVFLAISWIFVMIVQLHCQQQLVASPSDQLTGSGGGGGGEHHSYHSARHFYCNTKFLNSLMYCNNHESKLFSS